LERSTGQNSTAESAAPGTQPAGPAFNFADPVQVEHVPRVVPAVAFENYLRQLDRLGLFKIGMIGFQIRHAESLFVSNDNDTFHGIVSDVAEAIFENTRYAHALITYCGSGAFVAVVPRVRLFDRQDLETGIGLTLHEFEFADPLEPNFDIQVSVGTQVNGSVFGNNPAKMIEQAVRAAQGGPDAERSRTRASHLWNKFA
jgi:hypothetical protein